jgi:prevent-host-death family protein
MGAFKKSQNNRYTVHESKTHFSKLLELVANGTEVIIAKGNKEVAKLVPLQISKKRNFGFAKDLIQISDDFDDSISYREFLEGKS